MEGKKERKVSPNPTIEDTILYNTRGKTKSYDRNLTFPMYDLLTRTKKTYCKPFLVT